MILEVTDTTGQLCGKWYHKSNGSTINVRDAIIQDEEMIIMLDDGRSMNMKYFSDNYIQMGDTDLGITNAVVNNYTPTQEELGDLTPDIPIDAPSLDVPFGEITHSTPSSLDVPFVGSGTQQVNTQTQYKPTPNSDIIKKVFKKNLPIYKVSIEWATDPSKELDMLREYFEIPKKEIIEFIKNNCSIDYTQIENSIDGLFGEEEDDNCEK